MRILLTNSARNEFKRRVQMGSHSMPSVSPMNGSPTFDTDKKTQKRAEFKTPLPYGQAK